MSKSNGTENSLLLLLFNATTFANVAINATSSPLTNLYVALHTADPGETGTQSTSECAYGSYARVAVARTSGGWTVTNNTVNPAATITFPEATSGSETATYFSVGADVSGAGRIFYRGQITTPGGGIVITTTVIPELTTATAITED